MIIDHFKRSQGILCYLCACMCTPGYAMRCYYALHDCQEIIKLIIVFFFFIIQHIDKVPTPVFVIWMRSRWEDVMSLLDRKKPLCIIGPWYRCKANILCNSFQVLSYTCWRANEWYIWGFSCTRTKSSIVNISSYWNQIFKILILKVQYAHLLT